MTRFLSALLIITIAWTSTIQAEPYHANDHVTSINANCPVSATMAAVNAEGDPRKAAKAFLSTDTLKSTGMSMLTAGATYGLLSGFELPTNITELKTFGDHAANQGVNAAVKVGADLASTGRVDGAAVALGAVAGTLGSYLSTKIGQWHGGALNTVENELVHDVLHTLKGGVEGYIVGGEKGMAAGALGAFVAEKTAKLMMPTGGINREGAVKPKYTEEMTRKTMAIARLVTGMVAFSTGMSADQIGVAMMSANTSLDHNFKATAMRHAGANVEVKDEIIDEDTLSAEAKANGVSQEEINTVTAKLQNLSIENLGNAPTASDLITNVPTSPEAIEETQKSIIKGYVQKIAAVNENIHQILKEHPWAEKSLTKSAQMFGTCVRAMVYIDMGILGAAGGTGLCATMGVKNPTGLRTCALAGGAVSLAATAIVIEPSIESAIQEVVQYLSQQAAERFGDTPQEKAAIQQLVGDTANVAGLLAGAKYLHSRLTLVKGPVAVEKSTAGKGINHADELLTTSFEKINLDYSHPEAPFCSRIDPITGKGPMSIDSRNFTSATSLTSEGAARNAPQFWKLWTEKYPETISVDNFNLIHLSKNPLSPIVDAKWVEHFPEHQRYMNQVLDHHHINHGYLVNGLPADLHRKAPGRAIFHTNLGGKS